MNSVQLPCLYKQMMRLGAAALLVIVGAACSSTPAPTPLVLRQPTSTVRPTATSLPVSTPVSFATLTPTPPPTPAYLVTTISAGEDIELGDLALRVTPILTTDALAAVQPGRQLVLLDITIQNKGEKLVSINAARDIVLKDGSDRFYKISPAAVVTSRGTTPDVDLIPGEIVRTQAGFYIPLDADTLTFSFAADKFKAGRVFVRLPSTAMIRPTEAPEAVAEITATPSAATAVVIPTPTAALAAPTPARQIDVRVALLDPPDDTILTSNVTFRWSLSQGSLPVDAAYEVILYREGQDPLKEGLGMVAPTLATAIQVNLTALTTDPRFLLQSGQYLWSVRLVEQSTGRRLSMAAQGRRLIFQTPS